MKNFNKLQYLSIVIISISLLTACKKELDTDSNSSEVSIRVVIAGTDNNDSANKLASTMLAANMDEELTTKTQTIESKDLALDITTGVEKIEFNGNTTEQKGLNKLAATTPLANDVTYRIVGYTAGTTQKVFDHLHTINGTTPATIPTPKGTFDIYIYTFNTADPDLPSPEIKSGSTEPTIPINHSNDLLLWSVKNQVINSPNTSLGSGNIVLQHKTIQVAIEIDTDRLFANIDNLQFAATLLDGPLSVVKAARYQLKNDNLETNLEAAEYTTLTSLSNTLNALDNYFQRPTGRPNVITAKFHFTKLDANLLNRLKNLNISITSLAGTKINTQAYNYLTAGPRTVYFGNSTGNSSQYTPALGQRLVARLKLVQKIESIKILYLPAHIWSTYPSQTMYAGSAPRNMIQSQDNYGTKTTSIVRMADNATITHVDGYNSAYNATSLRDIITEEKPDIIISTGITRGNSTNQPYTDDMKAPIKEYLDKGGVVIMTIGATYGNEHFRTFFSSLMDYVHGITTPTFTSNQIDALGYGTFSLPARSRYQFTNRDDEILNGPFGDVREKWWGAGGDGWWLSVVSSQNISVFDNYFTTYSGPTADSENQTPKPNITRNLYTMYKSKTKHLFVIHDFHFLATANSTGVSAAGVAPPNAALEASAPFGTYGDYSASSFGTTYTQNTSQYLAYFDTNSIPRPNTPHLDYPVPRPQFKGSQSGYTLNGYRTVYNSTLFANLMSWAFANATLFGYNSMNGADLPSPYIDLANVRAGGR